MLKSSKVCWHSSENFANTMMIYLSRALDTHDSGKLSRKITHAMTLHLSVKTVSVRRRLRIADCGLRTADCKLQTRVK